METAEKDCSILGNLFQTIINDLRVSKTAERIWKDTSTALVGGRDGCRKLALFMNTIRAQVVRVILSASCLIK